MIGQFKKKNGKTVAIKYVTKPALRTPAVNGANAQSMCMIKKIIPRQ